MGHLERIKRETVTKRNMDKNVNERMKNTVRKKREKRN